MCFVVHHLLLLVIHVSNVCDYDDGDCGREYPVNPIPFSGSYAIRAFTKAVLFQLTFESSHGWIRHVETDARNVEGRVQVFATETQPSPN